MRSLQIIVLISAVTALASGCSKSVEPAERSVVVLALNENGSPQLNYSGPGALNYHYSLDSFSFDVGPVAGSSWIMVKGEITVGDKSEATLKIHSSSDPRLRYPIVGCIDRRRRHRRSEGERDFPVAAGEQDFVDAPLHRLDVRLHEAVSESWVRSRCRARGGQDRSTVVFFI